MIFDEVLIRKIKKIIKDCDNIDCHNLEFIRKISNTLDIYEIKYLFERVKQQRDLKYKNLLDLKVKIQDYHKSLASEIKPLVNFDSRMTNRFDLIPSENFWGNSLDATYIFDNFLKMEQEILRDVLKVLYNEFYESEYEAKSGIIDALDKMSLVHKMIENKLKTPLVESWEKEHASYKYLVEIDDNIRFIKKHSMGLNQSSLEGIILRIKDVFVYLLECIEQADYKEAK